MEKSSAFDEFFMKAVLNSYRFFNFHFLCNLINQAILAAFHEHFTGLSFKKRKDPDPQQKILKRKSGFLNSLNGVTMTGF